MRIGALTIGQSPRPDVVPEFLAALGVETDLVQRGALDGLTDEEIEKLKPGRGDLPLVTRLRDGREVAAAERHIIELMKQRIGEFEHDDVDIIVLFCTGAFPELVSRKMIVRPDMLIKKVVQGLLGKGGKAAVIFPSRDQLGVVDGEWEQVGLNLVFDAVSPYSGTTKDVEETARRVGLADPDLIVLDCMGFSERHKALFRKIAGVPVILPRSMLGRIVGELAGDFSR
jgi:protein AroM